MDITASTLTSLQHLVENISFATLLDFIGTLAFAISGIRLASAKRFDLFGAYVVGVTTAIGGGTIRDIMLGIPIFWMHNPFYLVCSALALFWVIAFRRLLVRQNNTWFLFDTIGLALFTVTGIEKSIGAGFPFWTAIIMGTLTGAGGGVFRDVLINEVPLIFRKEIYALACVIGGIAYWACVRFCGFDHVTAGLVCGSAVIIMRLLAVKFRLHLPVLRGEDI
ncbi:MAG: trimeric intracellular cation channel family protein [Alloprevotella sp.]